MQQQQKKCGKKSLSAFEVFKWGLFEQTKTFSLKMYLIFSATLMKNAFYTNLGFFHKNRDEIKNEICERKIFKLQRYGKVLHTVG